MFTEKVMLCTGVTVDKCMHKQTELSSVSDKMYIRAVWNPQLGGPTNYGTLNYTSAVYIRLIFLQIRTNLSSGSMYVSKRPFEDRQSTWLCRMIKGNLDSELDPGIEIYAPINVKPQGRGGGGSAMGWGF